MKVTFFSNCKILEEVKRLYKNLAKQDHPDRGGTKRIERSSKNSQNSTERKLMQATINQEQTSVIIPAKPIAVFLFFTWVAQVKQGQSVSFIIDWRNADFHITLPNLSPEDRINAVKYINGNLQES